MKKLIYIFSFLLFAVSCEKGLEDLPLHEDAEITMFYFEYRYTYVREDDSKEVVNRVKFTTSSFETVEVSEEESKVLETVTVPAADAGNNFPDEERNKITLSNIVGSCNVSLGAKLETIDDAPELGVPGDFSTSPAYKIVAADGSMKKWTVEVTLVK